MPAKHQCQRRRQAGGNQRPDIGLLRIGAAEIAVQQIAEIGAELDQQRLVEAELMADVGDRLGRSAAAGDHAGRIGRKGVEQHEGDGRYAEQDESRLRQPAQHEGRHQPLPRWVGSRMSRSASPTRLKESAVRRMIAPGMKTSQGAAWK